MKRIILIASLIGGLMFLAGCRKDFGRGGEIRFVASSVAGPRTRAEYSGVGRESNGLLTWERIDWNNGDLIRIWSDAAKTSAGDVYSDYKVSSFKVKSGDITRSQATVENVNSNGLNWDGVESACGFWAVYPASMVETGTTTRTVDLSITGAQTSSDGLTSAPMVAAVDNATPGDPVTLDFYPAFTAFEITLKSLNQDITLNTFALTSASKSLSGTFTAVIAANGSTFTCPGRTDATGKVEYTFDSGTVITSTEEVTFTVLALPQDYNDLTLEFSVTSEGVDQISKLALTKADGTAYPFSACSKHRIYGLAMPGGVWQLDIQTDVNDWTVQETATSSGALRK